MDQIGVDLTGELSEMEMLIWSNAFREKLIAMNVKNYFQQRLVGNITLLPTVIPKGWKIVDNELVFSNAQKELDEKENMKEDKRTMLIIKEIANSIDNQFSVTFDVPSNHPDGRVPILDVKVAVNKNNKVDYIFFKKPMANIKVIQKNSAMSYRQKITTLTQECFRRLHNTSEEIDENVKVVILNEFMMSLKVSGYNESEREIILKGGINTYEKLKKKESEGIRPFYRGWEYKHKQLKNKTVNSVDKKKNTNWFQKGTKKYATVMFVEATEGDTLLKMLKETEERFRISEDMRIKFISKTGPKLMQLFQRKGKNELCCEAEDCIPCVQAKQSDDPPQNCRKKQHSL